LPTLGVDAFLVTHLPHVRLLSGFSGSNGQLLVRRRSVLFQSDGRYEEQAKREVKGCRVRIAVHGGLIDDLRSCGALRGVSVLGFDEQRLPVAMLRTLRKQFPGLRFKPISNGIEPLAALKDSQAMRSIKTAVAITDRVFIDLLPFIRPGVSERELAAEITYRQLRAGAEGDSFEPIVLSGPRTSLIHGRPSSRTFRAGDVVLLDFGCRVNGYCSDMTRTVAVGRIDRRLEHVYGIVREAQQRALDAARPGAAVNDIDAAARDHIARAGFGPHFAHGLGHGIGLEVHEAPFLSWRSRSSLAPGNVVTVEPGIYLPGVGGVRIEDVVAVGPSASRVLTRSTKDLLVL
jgi:Xaa-Pro aminopeptidase